VAGRAVRVAIPMTRVSAEAVTASIALGGRASAVVVGPDGEHIYVAQSDSVAVISSCHHIVARIPLDDEPKDLALDAAGRRLFAITYDGSVSVINTCDYTMKTIPCHWGSDVAVSPDGRYQYVARTDNHQILGHSVISAIDAGGRTIATMSVVSLVTGLTVSPDGTRLCAISSDRGSYYQYPPGWLTIIDTARHAVLSTLAIGSNPETVRGNNIVEARAMACRASATAGCYHATNWSGERWQTGCASNLTTGDPPSPSCVIALPIWFVRGVQLTGVFLVGASPGTVSA
jgi:DNA-binding beta-propeller fold protein YncE